MGRYREQKYIYTREIINNKLLLSEKFETCTNV